ncbi:MAG: histidine utilization repressor [Thiotrichales bacterium]|nr:histidine utilization repressor [Thiotrichales bacterium]
MMSAKPTGFNDTGVSTEPAYQRIKRFIVEQIDTGIWASGQRTPSENELVRTFGVSRMTANRALRELTQQGRLMRVHGVGTFVAQPKEHASLIELRDIAEEIVAAGSVHSVRIINQCVIAADESVAGLLDLGIDTSVFHITLVHHRDQIPIQIEDRYVNPLIAPDFLSTDFHRSTPTRALLSVCAPDHVEHVVQAVRSDEATCARLQMATDEPCLCLRRRTWWQGKVVTAVKLLYPGDRYDLAARYSAHQQAFKIHS